MSSASPPDAPQPRLCHVKKWSDFNGYGFNLHAEKNKHGHHIGALDAGSPAEAAGLKEGDRIVEVNGTNIANENHQQVVSRIRAVNNEVKLLVVDPPADEYYRERRVVVRGDMAGVVAITTPPTMAAFQADPRAGYAEGAAGTTDESDPAPRLAKLRTWLDFQGYGFNLTSEKSKSGQYIGKVDTDSPADTANVREGDRIIEVNGVNVTEETHHQVVSRIKARPGQVDLLLVDKETDSFYSSRGTVIRGDMPQVVVAETPERGKDTPPSAQPPPIPELDIEEAEVTTAVVVAAAAEAEADEVEEEPMRRRPGSPSLEAEGQTEPEPEAQENAATEPEPELQAAPFKEDMPSPMEESTAVAAVAAAAAAADAITRVDDNAPHPRLCHIKKWSTFAGYGFNLNAGKANQGHFIGGVDTASPSDLGGLQKDDQIIEVNGSNIWEDDHTAVVAKITANPNQVQLLVADKATEKYYKDKDIKIHGDMVQVVKIVCPDQAPGVEDAVDTADAAVVNAAVIATSIKPEPDDPCPRLCHIKRWADFQGYGFNLNAEKGRVGNFIGSVDANSPAQAAGILAGDNIIEVNGDDVEDATHGQVVEKITTDKTKVTMLLADNETAAFYKAKGIKINSGIAAVKVITCPDSKPVSEVSAGETAAPNAADIPIPVPLVAATVNSHAPEADAPPMRMCHLKKWHDFQGYGFNLHDEKGVAGHFVGKVDVESPAESAGLRVKDKIIEVNGEPVNEDDHHQVVQRVTSDPSGVSLLVADAAANDYFRAHNLRPHGQMANITVITCPAHRAQSIVQESPVSLEQSEPEPEHHRSSAAVTTSTVAMASVISNGVDHHPPASLRLCTVNKWVEYDGYGFNLHDEQGRPGHFIGSVEPGSPAESTGLRKGDQIYEVNGATVQTADHHVVIQHVLENPDQVQMLVGQPDVGQYYLEHEHQWPHSLMASVERNVGSKHSPARVSVTTSAAAPKPEPTIRLCHLRKWTTYEGYGFRLHDDKKKPGHFIGPLEPGSPADLAGLAKGDRVVEVNGVSCKDMDHHQVVSCITANPGEVRLLVLSVDANAYYTKLGTWPHGAMPNVSRIECPNMQPGAATNGVPEAKVDEIDVVEHNGHAYVQPDRHLAREPSPEPAPPTPEVVYRAPTPEPIRVPTPEPVRAPTPEPVPVALVEVARVPTPEPVREPSLEPVRQPSPAPVRQPSPVREIKIDEPLYDVADPVVMTEEIETNRIFIVPPPPPLPEEMNGSHVVTTETEVSHMESNVVRPDHESVVTVGHIAPVAAVGVAADKLSIASSVATSEASSTAEAGYNLEEAEITAETSEVARHMESEDVTGTGAQLAYEHMPMSVAKSSSNEAVYQNVEPVVEQGIFTTVISVSSDPTIAEVPRPSVEPVAVSSEHVVATHHSESCTVTTEMNEVVMRSLRSLTDNGHVDEVSVLETSTQPLPEFNDALNMASSKRSSTSTISDSVTHYAFTEEADELAMGGDVAESHVTENPLAVDITESHFIEIDARPTKFHISESHVTEDEVAGGLVTERQVTDHQATESHITRSHVTESHVTKGVAVNEFMSPDEPTVVQITTTTSYSYSKPVVDEPDSPAPTPATGADPMAGSLQDVLSRVKSRKKPQARTGNLSMKEKFELFQQL